MHESNFSGISYQFSIGKMKKLEIRFPKPKTGFKTKNRISSFQLTSLLVTNIKMVQKIYGHQFPIC